MKFRSIERKLDRKLQKGPAGELQRSICKLQTSMIPSYRKMQSDIYS